MFREMRRGNQQVSEEACKKVLLEGKRAVLSLLGDHGYPYGLPINYLYSEDENRIYFHCAKSGHKIDAMENCDKVCFTVWSDGYKEEGHWEWTLTSAIVFGRAREMTDPELIQDRVRNLARRYYPSEEEIDQVMKRSLSRLKLFAIEIEHMTGKLIHES